MTIRTSLVGLTPEHERVVRRAVHAVVEAVYYDLEKACADANDPLTNEALMECVCDQLFGEDPINLQGDEGWDKDVFAAWRAIDYQARMQWMLENFNYC